MVTREEKHHSEGKNVRRTTYSPCKEKAEMVQKVLGSCLFLLTFSVLVASPKKTTLCCQTCSADHERDWPPCKVCFGGLATQCCRKWPDQYYGKPRICPSRTLSQTASTQKEVRTSVPPVLRLCSEFRESRSFLWLNAKKMYGRQKFTKKKCGEIRHVPHCLVF